MESDLLIDQMTHGRLMQDERADQWSYEGENEEPVFTRQLACKCVGTGQSDTNLIPPFF